MNRERDAARQRAAATRRRETDEARAERCVSDCLRVPVIASLQNRPTAHTHETIVGM